MLLATSSIPTIFQRQPSTAVKSSLLTQRSSADDSLAINSETLHQYYCTVQSEVHPETLVDEAMNRRQANALMARRKRSRLSGWAVFAVLALAMGGLVWLLG